MPGTASATDKAPVGFGRAAGMPPNAAQVPTAMVAAAPPANIACNLQGGFTADHAIGAVGAGRNRAFDQRNILAGVVTHRSRQHVLSLTAGRGHQSLVIAEGNRIENKIGDGWVPGAQKRFAVAGAVLEFKPQQDRSCFAFHRRGDRPTCGIRQPENRRHRCAKCQKLATGNTAVFEFFPEAMTPHDTASIAD
jgi:hypothetical protein